VSASEVAHDGVRRSRVTKWRAAVLILVHVAIAAHVAHWWAKGETLSPLEPSEGIELSSRGVLNAGAIFFAALILSTALLGRWFCGWGCHVVALQDLCRGMLVKVGIRPRLAQLGLLGLVPWILFVYMFLAPLAYRAIGGEDLGVAHVELSTKGFWETFPAWPMSIATIAICGFAIVYVLGAKGFCTYGCPYGAIFGIADQLAPLRIRVTDACEGCGHCTSVCTSNVRVHQEVRDWKTVVDPGCMKCLDCVSVCPKGALYVGWGAPAFAAKGSTAKGATPASERGGRLGRTALAALFTWATFTVLLARKGTLEPGFAAALAVGSLLIAILFAGKSARAGGPSLGEEAFVAIAFLVALFSFRGVALFPGLSDVVPLLLSVGLATITAYVALVAWRMLRMSEVKLQNLALLRGRRPTRSGVAFAALLVVPLAALTFRGGRLQVESFREAAGARAAEEKAQAEKLARAVYDRGVAHAQSGDWPRALEEFAEAVRLAPDFVEARDNLAGAFCAAGRLDEGIAQYQESLRLRPGDPDTLVLLGRAHFEKREFSRAEEHWNAALRLRADHPGAHLGLALICEQRGDAAGVAQHRAAVRR
jgi:polyferredoxin